MVLQPSSSALLFQIERKKQIFDLGMAKYIPDFNTNILDTRKLALVENYYYKNKMFDWNFNDSQG